MEVIVLLLLIVLGVFCLCHPFKNASHPETSFDSSTSTDDYDEWEEWQENGKLYQNYSYEELLRTDEWKEKRREILRQHHYRCDWCGYDKKLQAHHKYYLKYPNNVRVCPWEYPDDAFMCLCDRCHKKYHQKYEVKTYYTKYR